MSTILIIDDAASCREPIAALLRLRGHETHTASNGREGLAFAREHFPDLILLDLAMPEMDGLGFLRQRVHDAQLRKVPVILMTAVSEKAYLAEAEELGIRCHLLKSEFSMTEMVAAIEKQLDAALVDRG